jgi:hypothetical protein
MQQSYSDKGELSEESPRFPNTDHQACTDLNSVCYNSVSRTGTDVPDRGCLWPEEGLWRALHFSGILICPGKPIAAGETIDNKEHTLDMRVCQQTA